MDTLTLQTPIPDWPAGVACSACTANVSIFGTPYSEIGDLNPLHADQVCAGVPDLNGHADVRGLARALRAILPTESAITGLSVPQCLAAMRDLGLFLGSIKRHAADPLATVPEVEPVLLLLAQRTAMLPRDTVYHYGPWNAPAPRQRRYVGSPQEDALIQSVRLALPQVEAAIPLLASLQDYASSDPAFASICRHATSHVQAMVQAINLVRRDVTADYFARVMRPYFEDVCIAGTTYFGPAAAHIPLYLVDRILWSVDHPEPAHLRFQHEGMLYGPPHWRKLFEDWEGKKSITTRVVEDIAAAEGEPSAELRDSVEALCDLYRVIITFRGRHAVLARAAYDVGRRLYPAGSGGGTVELLWGIVDRSRVYAGALRASCPAVAPNHMHGALDQP